MVQLEVDNLKTLREALCIAQSGITQAYGQRQSAYVMGYVKVIEDTINKIDILRPLGPNGKHGNLHTDFCGCDPNPLVELKRTWRVVPGYPGYKASGAGHLCESTSDDGYPPYEYTPKIDANGEAWYTLYIPNQGPGHLISRTLLLQMTFPELKKSLDG